MEHFSFLLGVRFWTFNILHSVFFSIKTKQLLNVFCQSKGLKGYFHESKIAKLGGYLGKFRGRLEDPSTGLRSKCINWFMNMVPANGNRRWGRESYNGYWKGRIQTLFILQKIVLYFFVQQTSYAINRESILQELTKEFIYWYI